MTENSKKPAVSIDLFDDDERQIINQLIEGASLCISRSELLSLIANMRKFISIEDTGFSDLADSLYSKVKGLLDEEWDDIKRSLPFPVNISVLDDFMAEDDNKAAVMEADCKASQGRAAAKLTEEKAKAAQIK